MYRVFEALDELVTIVEEARGLPMTAYCVVPRGDVLELLDDVRDALPGEVDDAQDVLDHRDQIVGERRARGRATTRRRRRRRRPSSRWPRRGPRRTDWSPAARGAGRATWSPAREEAERAHRRAAQPVHDSLARAHAEADRLVAAGRASYERSVADGQAEQARLVTQTEVVQAAYTESARILDTADADADRMRRECDTLRRRQARASSRRPSAPRCAR